MKDVCKKLKGDGEDMKSETTASETSVSETVHEGRSAVEEEQLVFVEGRRKKSEKERDFSGHHSFKKKGKNVICQPLAHQLVILRLDTRSPHDATSAASVEG